MHPYYIIRFLGGLLYLIGMLIMAYNVYKTIRGPELVKQGSAEAQAEV